MCEHDWTPMYTDRNSPESFGPNGGAYRGFRYVGWKCRRCGENICCEPTTELPPAPGAHGCNSDRPRSVTPENLCLCAYNWRIVHMAPDRLRLVYCCLPEYGKELAKRLRDRGFFAVIHGTGRLWVHRPSDLARLAKALGATPGLAAALDDYALAWLVKSSAPETRLRRVDAARRVMDLLPASDAR